jgi:hypothetical protein
LSISFTKSATGSREAPVSSGPAPKLLGEILVQQVLITPAQLAKALERHTRTSQPLAQVIVDMGFVTADTLLETVSAQTGIPTTRVNVYTIDPGAINVLPEQGGDDDPGTAGVQPQSGAAADDCRCSAMGVLLVPDPAARCRFTRVYAQCQGTKPDPESFAEGDVDALKRAT